MSELKRLVYGHLEEIARIGHNPNTDSHIDDLERYITANYTPNSEVMRLRLEHAAKLANLDQKIAWLEGKIE